MKGTSEQDTEEDVTVGDESIPSDGKETNSDTAEKETLQGVTISEEFQQECYELLEKASKSECDYLRDACYRRQDDIRSEERKEELKKEGKNGKPNAVVRFTDSDMPSSG